jgi:hypothetical protein
VGGLWTVPVSSASPPLVVRCAWRGRANYMNPPQNLHARGGQMTETHRRSTESLRRSPIAAGKDLIIFGCGAVPQVSGYLGRVLLVSGSGVRNPDGALSTPRCEDVPAVMASPQPTRYARRSQASLPCRGSDPGRARTTRRRREPAPGEPAAATARCRARRSRGRLARLIAR